MAAETGEFWKSFFPQKNNEEDYREKGLEMRSLVFFHKYY